MARKRQKQPLVGWIERSEAHAVVLRAAVMGFAVLSPSYVLVQAMPANSLQLQAQAPPELARHRR